MATAVPGMAAGGAAAAGAAAAGPAADAGAAERPRPPLEHESARTQRAKARRARMAGEDSRSETRCLGAHRRAPRSEPVGLERPLPGFQRRGRASERRLAAAVLGRDRAVEERLERRLAHGR